MRQTEYQIKLGNIKSNFEEPHLVPKISSEIENANNKWDERWRKSTDNTNNELLPRFQQKFKSSAKDDWVVSVIFAS